MHRWMRPAKQHERTPLAIALGSHSSNAIYRCHWRCNWCWVHGMHATGTSANFKVPLSDRELLKADLDCFQQVCSGDFLRDMVLHLDAYYFV